jgi:tRNA pseudouridine38-40 synthase
MVGRHDFKAFQTFDGRLEDSVRTVRMIRIAKEGSIISIDIEANGFLYNMVRKIVGTLVEIGRGKFPVGRAKELLKTRERRLCGPTMPAQGLCLMRVKY